MTFSFCNASRIVENMVNAIQIGVITPSTKERLDSLEADKVKVERIIATEKLEHPEIPKEYFVDWLKRLQSGEQDDPDYCGMIVDGFIHSAHLINDGLTFGLNLNLACGSDLSDYAPRKDLPVFWRVFYYCRFMDDRNRKLCIDARIIRIIMMVEYIWRSTYEKSI